MFEAGLYALLAGESTISALVSDRITPVRLPIDSPMPALTFKVIGGSSDATFDTSGLQSPRIEFACFGATHLQACALRDTVRKFLNGYRGLLNDGTFVQGFLLIEPMDFDEQYAREFRCVLEMYCMFNFSD